ncbi:hypothetical protein [Pelosinus fermentans]|uniref:hypothetical protein n=1 Tax=Pelosinus fermentans TaxID=365349 RepID=UPI00056841F8|nr:hypothetical protein [Pelosinus fermentans]
MVKDNAKKSSAIVSISKPQHNKKTSFILTINDVFCKHRKYKFLGAEKVRYYEPQRHNAANAAHKGVHEKINKTPLCPLRLCGSFSVFICLKGRTAFL